MKTSDVSTRLNKYLALHLGVSRRQADEYIASGRVRVNGAPITLGAQVTTTDLIYLDDKLVTSHTDYRYILLNKPTGYVCSRRPQGETPTIYSLLPPELHALKPVGRLDKDSAGLLILTNDGDFSHRMTHPSFHKQKTYEVILDRNLEPLHQQMISDYGVQLEDGPSKLTLERLSDHSRTDWRVLMHEGRNRQIRRTFASLGYTVTRLYRTHFGAYELQGLNPGSYEQFSPK